MKAYIKEMAQDVRSFLNDLTDLYPHERFGIFVLGPSIFAAIVLLIVKVVV